MIHKEFLFQTDFENKEELFKKTSSYLVESGYVCEEFEEALNVREAAFPTGLPTMPAVAIPHTDGTYVKKDTILCILNNNEMEFNEMGGDQEDVVHPRVIFVLVLKDGEVHLAQLQNLIEKIQEGKLLEGILASNNLKEFQQIVNKFL